MLSNKLYVLPRALCRGVKSVGDIGTGEQLEVPKLLSTDALRSNLFKLDWIHMMTKLRPFVHTFLKEASSLFEMYIYTMGERPYALEMANLLDPGGIYFHSRVIAQSDSTRRHQKGLDVVLGQESAVVILDDTEVVWGKHRENLILMDRYHFFTSSCRQFGLKCKSLSEQKSDENEAEGALASVLEVLQRIHRLFFDPERGDNIMERDVRQVLKTVRKEILKGCKIVFTGVIPIQCQPENHYYWKLAEKLGATFSTEVDESVTHVVSMNDKTEKSRQAVREKKFLVHPRWIEAANYLWRKPPEENFPVSS
ncbi:RNA polymerase II C-terminal domain phosphatase-like 4 [Solanum pennellii]|uniref:protein-serine/threonine phosphatase n=1 Tax=Solanum pennellii TaxID=28526 RepID=A0ABM1H6W7_SOLPN|nr:RNA polymerase II C-terminal domain phosphatase-like 4 [Solanum pennellii]